MIRIFDISREEDYKESLERTKERLELALLASQDGIWEWDVTTDHVYISPRWKEMLGYEDHEIENTYEAWQKVILPEDKEGSREMMHDFVKQKVDTFFITERYLHKKGHTVYIESRAVRVLDENGRTQKIVGSHTDITSLIEAGHQLRNASKQAQEANEAKSQFLANMSHEIRTPLLSILGFTEQLRDQNLTTEAEELVSFIQSSGKTLNQLLLDILDFERIRRGRLELAQEVFNPKAVVEEVCDMYRRKTGMKGLQFFVELEWEDNTNILGDEIRFRQILVNLLENAFKFTDEGAIRLIMLLREIEGRDHLCVCITDTGQGISEDFIENIFDAFTQKETSFARKYEGSGLGLGIVKQLVNLMEGTVSVESPPNLPLLDSKTGSRFIFTLPVTITSEASASPKDKAEPAAKLQSQTILLAEDNPLNRRIATHALNKFGLEVIVATDGGEAIEMVRKHPEIAAVLMDIRMPNVDGYESCIGIKAMRPDLPVIGLSANAYLEDIERSKEVGMDDYLSKPYSSQELYDVLRIWLKETNKTKVSSR